MSRTPSASCRLRHKETSIKKSICYNTVLNHPGILKGSREDIKKLRTTLFGSEYADVKGTSIKVVDFSDTAQGCKTYDEYIAKMAGIPEQDLAYFGIGICGDKKKVNKLTGSMPLLR